MARPSGRAARRRRSTPATPCCFGSIPGTRRTPGSTRSCTGRARRRQATYNGSIPRDPTGQASIAVGIINCTIHTFRPLDRASTGGAAALPGSQPLGLHTANNIYFPYANLAKNLAKQQPDLLVSLGDQLYEHRPTITSSDPAPTLDYLYRYYLWLWAFGSLTRDRPTIVMVDDHDVAQGNLWGHSGAAAPNGNLQAGGYVKAASFINMLQRIQTGHNPDAFDPTPVLQGIGVYYAAFRYGGVSFAILEDRKFKGGDADGIQANGTAYPSTTPLLGARQEQFLTSWASADAGMPKVCLTQTLWGCLQTDENGAKVTDFDSDGYPPKARLAPPSSSSRPAPSSSPATSTWAASSATASPTSATAPSSSPPRPPAPPSSGVRATRPGNPEATAAHRRLHRRVRQQDARARGRQPEGHVQDLSRDLPGHPATSR